MDTPKNINIDPLSARSLFLQIVSKNSIIASATGFIVEKEKTPYLITNWHVVSGREPDTYKIISQTGVVPDELRIVHHSANRLGEWAIHQEMLYLADAKPRWFEHPLGQRIDVIALPLKAVDNSITIYPLDMSLADTDIVVQPAMPVSIIGFPFGLTTAGAWPIWKTGHIASDPDLDYDERPAFLIDATTRSGMSGSPVVLRITGGYTKKDGTMVMVSGATTKFLGIYSGRIHGEAEIGKVWRPHVITDILDSIKKRVFD